MSAEHKTIQDTARAGGQQVSTDRKEDALLLEIKEKIKEAQRDAVNENLLWIRWIGPVRWLPPATMVLGLLVISSGIALAYSIDNLLPSVVVTLIGVLTAFTGTIFWFFYKARMAEARSNFEELESKESSTERARLKIQYYMHENLRQVRWIFWLSLMAMFLGFFIIISGAVLALNPWGTASDPQTSSIVTSLSGVIVEFIAATFLFIYRSTMKQASQYVDILGRLNTIGIATDLIEDINADSSSFRNNTRAHIASQILTAQLRNKEGE